MCVYLVRRILKSAAVVLLFMVPITANAALVVFYEGNELPSDFAQPFNNVDSGSGTREIIGGILHMDVTSGAGSLNSVRNDALLDTDSAVFQFRTRVTRVGTVGPAVIPGAVFQLRWSGDSGTLVFFVADGRVEMNGGGNPSNIVLSQRFSTRDFHTYSVVKDGGRSILLYVDGDLLKDLPLANFDFPFGSLSGWESFSNNPDSASDWDFFRYAIGPDALRLLPVRIPEPATVSLTLFALSLLGVIRCRPERRSAS